jgi:uncharacterized protein with GYD domain
MPKYLIQARYTQAGMQGVKSEGGSSRRDVVAKSAESIGGKVEAFYFAFGETDVIVIFDAPDNVAAARLAVSIGATGSVSLVTTPLLTAEEIDEAVKGDADYRKPGG